MNLKNLKKESGKNLKKSEENLWESKKNMKSIWGESK